MTWVTAIINQKGGVGKTTTCTSLGACLAESGHRTLIVDFDPQANLTLAAGLEPEELETSITDLLDPEMEEPIPPLEEHIFPTSQENLFILPADMGLAGIERLLYNQNEYEYSLRRILEPLSEKFDHILIDCPPSLGAFSIISLTAAQMVLIPVQCEFYAAHGVKHILEAIHTIKEYTNPKLDYRLLATMYDRRNKISAQVLEQLRLNFGEYFFETIISVNTRLRETALVGEPITIYAPKSTGCQNYRELAIEYLAVLQSR